MIQKMNMAVVYARGKKRIKRKAVTEMRHWSNGVEGRGGALIVSRKMV